MLTRSFNELTSQILSFKNKELEGKIVVVYDYDERVALARAARAPQFGDVHPSTLSSDPSNPSYADVRLPSAGRGEPSF